MFLTNLLLLLVAKSLVIEISAHDECCTRKMVGSVSYTLLPASTSHRELPNQCRNDCVYTVSGTSSPKFCFARGPILYRACRIGFCMCFSSCFAPPAAQYVVLLYHVVSSTGDLPTRCLSAEPGITLCTLHNFAPSNNHNNHIQSLKSSPSL